MRFRIVGTALKLRVWVAGGAEPGSWDLEYTDASLASGWVGLGAATQTGSNAVDWDYVGVTTDGGTVPAPGNINPLYRLAMVQNETTARKFYQDGVPYTDSGVQQRPGVGANILNLGFDDADQTSLFRGELGFVYLRAAVLSDAWLAAEALNLSTPSGFYTMGAEVAD